MNSRASTVGAVVAAAGRQRPAQRPYNAQRIPGATAPSSRAYLDKEGEKRFLSGAHRLRPGDWHVGDRAWLIDVIAPFGGADGVLTSLKQTVFKDRKLMALKP